MQRIKKPIGLLLIRYTVFTLMHLCVLRMLLYLDNHFILSENMLGILVIPLGLINCAILLTGFLSLKGFAKTGLLHFVFAAANFTCYALTSLSMYSQAGSITN